MPWPQSKIQGFPRNLRFPARVIAVKLLWHGGRLKIMRMREMIGKRACTLLCGVVAAALLVGCGDAMPELTQEETNLISEYAVGVLLKYDKRHKSRLVDTTGYDVVEAVDVEDNEVPSAGPKEEPEQEEEIPTDNTEVVDVSQDEEEAAVPATVEEYYGISDFTFQYTGYELDQNYPPNAEGDEVFFAMDATQGCQLLVLRFTVSNTGASDQTLNMLEHGARFRVSVNGEASQGALATMLLNDMQTYHDVVPAGSVVELVSIVEIPQSTSVETIDFILRGNGENATLSLQ